MIQNGQVLLPVGYGRSGKDHAAIKLHRMGKFNYQGSTSWAALPYMAKLLGICEQLAWETRHENREFWKKECDHLRMEAGDELYLVRLLMRRGATIVPGIRGMAEIQAAMRDPKFYIVWIDAKERGIVEDVTVPYGPEVADEIWPNNGTPEEYDKQIEEWVAVNRIQDYVQSNNKRSC